MCPSCPEDVLTLLNGSYAPPVATRTGTVYNSCTVLLQCSERVWVLGSRPDLCAAQQNVHFRQ